MIPAGADRTDLLVGVDEDVEGGVFGAGGVEPPEELDDEEQAPLHVVDPGAEDSTVLLAPELGPRTHRPDGVDVADEHDPVSGSRAPETQKRTVAVEVRGC